MQGRLLLAPRLYSTLSCDLEVHVKVDMMLQRVYVVCRHEAKHRRQCTTDTFVTGGPGKPQPGGFLPCSRVLPTPLHCSMLAHAL